jgi:hypothetical protein
MTGSTSSAQEGERTDENVKNLQPALDIGSHINAWRQLLPETGAQRRLAAVSCTPL